VIYLLSDLGRISTCLTQSLLSASNQSLKSTLAHAGVAAFSKTKEIRMRRTAPPVRHDDPTMMGQRAHDEDGELRRKRDDTKVETIEEAYDVDFNVRGDMLLDTLRERMGKDSVKKLVRGARKR